MSCLEIRAKREGTKRSHMLIFKARLLEDGQNKNIIYSSKVLTIFTSLHVLILAIRLFGKDWKKVEDHIGTRTGA